MAGGQPSKRVAQLQPVRTASGLRQRPSSHFARTNTVAAQPAVVSTSACQAHQPRVAALRPKSRRASHPPRAPATLRSPPRTPGRWLQTPVAKLEFASALFADRPDDLWFAGDKLQHVLFCFVLTAAWIAACRYVGTPVTYYRLLQAFLLGLGIGLIKEIGDYAGVRDLMLTITPSNSGAFYLALSQSSQDPSTTSSYHRSRETARLTEHPEGHQQTPLVCVCVCLCIIMQVWKGDPSYKDLLADAFGSALAAGGYVLLVRYRVVEGVTSPTKQIRPFVDLVRHTHTHTHAHTNTHKNMTYTYTYARACASST